MTYLVMLLIGVSVLMGSGSAGASPDNPFGFETTKHPRAYGYCKPVLGAIYRGYGYDCASAPRDHPALGPYALQYVDGVGVCLIDVSASRVHRDDIAALSTEIKDQIVKKYGPDHEFLRDERAAGSGLAMNDYFWLPPIGTPGIGDVAAIHLNIYQDLQGKIDGNAVRVRVTLTTMPECRAAMDEFDREEVKEAQEEQHDRREAF